MPLLFTQTNIGGACRKHVDQSMCEACRRKSKGIYSFKTHTKPTELFPKSVYCIYFQTDSSTTISAWMTVPANIPEHSRHCSFVFVIFCFVFVCCSRYYQCKLNGSLVKVEVFRLQSSFRLRFLPNMQTLKGKKNWGHFYSEFVMMRNAMNSTSSAKIVHKQISPERE